MGRSTLEGSNRDSDRSTGLGEPSSPSREGKCQIEAGYLRKCRRDVQLWHVVHQFRRQFADARLCAVQKLCQLTLINLGHVKTEFGIVQRRVSGKEYPVQLRPKGVVIQRIRETGATSDARLTEIRRLSADDRSRHCSH